MARGDLAHDRFQLGRDAIRKAAVTTRGRDDLDLKTAFPPRHVDFPNERIGVRQRRSRRSTSQARRVRTGDPAAGRTAWTRSRAHRSRQPNRCGACCGPISRAPREERRAPEKRAVLSYSSSTPSLGSSLSDAEFMQTEDPSGAVRRERRGPGARRTSRTSPPCAPSSSSDLRCTVTASRADRSVEARPTRTRIVFRRRIEERLTTTYAVIHAGCLRIPVPSGERPLGTAAPRYLEFLVRRIPRHSSSVLVT